MKTKLILWYLFLWVSLLSTPAFGQVTQIIGAAVDPVVPPTLPCTTFGFVEEAQLTLPTGFNNGVMIRVMPSRTTNIPYNNLGYAITEVAAVNTQLTVFDLTTMTIRASATISTPAGKYRLAQRVQGDLDTDGRLYIFREAAQGGPSCPAGSANCISFARFLENASMQLEGITGNCITSNIDDARDGGSGSYVTISNRDPICGGTGREFRLWSKSSLAFSSLGTQFGISAFGHLSRLFNGNVYGCLTDATNTCRRIPSGSATSNATFSFTSSFSTRLLGAIYPAVTDFVGNTNQILGSSDQTGGVQARRAFVNESNLVNCCTNLYAAGGTDGAAIFQGTFYDALNNKVFSARVDGINEELIRTTPGPNTFTVEATLNCVNCNYNGGSASGSQVIDYAPHKARLFTISTTSPAVINRIRICATGGPPA